MNNDNIEIAHADRSTVNRAIGKTGHKIALFATSATHNIRIKTRE